MKRIRRTQSSGGRAYKIRAIKIKQRNGETHQFYNFGLPPDVAAQIPEGARFTCEITEDGILYRVIKPPPPKPSWLKQPGDSKQT
jgi:hypothetical protein